MLQVDGWEGEGRVGVGGRWQMHSGSSYDVPNCPQIYSHDHATRLRRYHSYSWKQLQANNTQMVCSTGTNVLVMDLQDYKSIHQKADHLNLAAGRHSV